jgi:outer membrane lipoprotein carrier protein
MRTLIPSLLLILMPATGLAGSLERLKHFVTQTQSAKAAFQQTVLDRNLKPVQQSRGTVQFQRPGKFRWIYEKPYTQLLIGDGQKVWIYDPDLNQVTVKKMGEAIGSSPAALLAGSNEIEKYFKLTNLGRQEGLEWLEAVPKAKDAGFEKVRLGFGGENLEAMELRDHFGQVTVIRFDGFQRNAALSPDTFKFVPPKGADIIGD